MGLPFKEFILPPLKALFDEKPDFIDAFVRVNPRVGLVDFGWMKLHGDSVPNRTGGPVPTGV